MLRVVLLKAGWSAAAGAGYGQRELAPCWQLPASIDEFICTYTIFNIFIYIT
jgi:hypothetical protein